MKQSMPDLRRLPPHHFCLEKQISSLKPLNILHQYVSKCTCLTSLFLPRCKSFRLCLCSNIFCQKETLLPQATTNSSYYYYYKSNRLNRFLLCTEKELKNTYGKGWLSLCSWHVLVQCKVLYRFSFTHIRHSKSFPNVESICHTHTSL